MNTKYDIMILITFTSLLLLFVPPRCLSEIYISSPLKIYTRELSSHTPTPSPSLTNPSPSGKGRKDPNGSKGNKGNRGNKINKSKKDKKGKKKGKSKKNKTIGQKCDGQSDKLSGECFAKGQCNVPENAKNLSFQLQVIITGTAIDIGLLNKILCYGASVRRRRHRELNDIETNIDMYSSRALDLLSIFISLLVKVNEGELLCEEEYCEYTYRGFSCKRAKLMLILRVYFLLRCDRLYIQLRI